MKPQRYITDIRHPASEETNPKQPVAKEVRFEPPNLPMTHAQPAAHQKERPSALSWLLLVILGVSLGLLPFHPKVGLWLVLGYSLLGLVLRLKSIYFFGPALFSVVLLPAYIFRDSTDVAEHYATYCFLLIVFGTFTLILEDRKRPERE